MALIICPECGKEISDKSEVCIGCGYPVNEIVVDNRSDLEKLVDEIYYKHKGDRADSAKELVKRTGMDFKAAMKLMQDKKNSPEVKAEEKRKRQKYKEEQRQLNRELRESFQTLCGLVAGSKVAKCPRCRSTSISYDTKKLSIGRALVGDAIAGAPGAVLGGLSSKKGYAVCLNCGKRWKI